MTVKRFKVYKDNRRIDINDNGKSIGNIYHVCALLNRISEENEQLKTKNFAYLQDIEVFKEENTHLKLENERLKEAIDEADDLIKSHLSAHYNRKWENICEYLGVDLND